jgi:hypothetical protein
MSWTGERSMNDFIVSFLLFFNLLNLWAIKKTLKIWLPRMKALEADAEALKLELWVRQ